MHFQFYNMNNGLIHQGKSDIKKFILHDEPLPQPPPPPKVKIIPPPLSIVEPVKVENITVVEKFVVLKVEVEAEPMHPVILAINIAAGVILMLTIVLISWCCSKKEKVDMDPDPETYEEIWKER